MSARQGWVAGKHHFTYTSHLDRQAGGLCKIQIQNVKKCSIETIGPIKLHSETVKLIKLRAQL